MVIMIIIICIFMAHVLVCLLIYCEKTLCDYFDGTVIVEQYEYEKDFTCFWVCLKFTRTKDFLVIADYKHVLNMRAFFYFYIKVLIERHLHNIDF